MQGRELDENQRAGSENPQAWQQRDLAQTREPIPKNVGRSERAASLALGGLLLYRSLARARDWRHPGTLGASLASLGLALAGRGVTGRCPVYRATGLDSSQRSPLRMLIAGRDTRSSSEVVIEQRLTVHRPRDKAYERWRKLSSLPEILEHIEEVREDENGRSSHWVAQGPLGQRIEWDAEIIDDRPGERIAWHSLPGSEVENEGEVRFQSAPAGRGTEVAVRICYRAASGALNPLLAKLSNHALHEDLRRFKQWIEAGELPTTEGQPHGEQRAASEKAETKTMKKVRAAKPAAAARSAS